MEKLTNPAHRQGSPFGQPTRTSSPTPISNQNLNFSGRTGSIGPGGVAAPAFPGNDPQQYGDRFQSSSDRYGSPDRYAAGNDRYGSERFRGENADRFTGANQRDERYGDRYGSYQSYGSYGQNRYDTFGSGYSTPGYGPNRTQTYRYGPQPNATPGTPQSERAPIGPGGSASPFYRGIPARGDSRNYARNLINRFNLDNDRRRRQEQPFFTPSGQMGGPVAPLGQEPIRVELTEFYPRDNAKEHHTDMFELISECPPTPIFRRGQNFFFAVRFDRPFDPQRDNVRISFGFGPRPTVTKGTRVILPVAHQHENATLPADKLRWNCNIHRQDGNTLTLHVYIPATAQVGIWHCTVQTSRVTQKDFRYDYECEDDLYILFNPWCRDDSVYLESEIQRREYILNENGKVFCGTYRHPKGRRWAYGQFDDVVLPAAMYLLEQANLPHTDRGSPVQVVRAISSVVQALYDTGLLENRCDGQYFDGITPQAWTGTVAIMERYLQEGGRPVKYGQCWVFSAVTVSICRALGIPCRSVTNYVSARDTNRSLTIDKYFDRDGNEIPLGPDGDNYDQCWNFHCWNDVWMQRPDLPPGYGGWQVIDPTPKEENDNYLKCGPASLEAIRRGEIGFSYDTPYVYSEINADLCHFQEDETSDWGFSRLAINYQYHIGRKLVTKRIDRDDDDGDQDCQDITAEYKNPDGSHTERLGVYNAIRGVSRAQQYYDFPEQTQEDVIFDLVDCDNIQYGQSFDVIINIHNKSNDIRTVQAVLSCQSVFYTGQTACRLKRSQGEFIVRPNQREILKIHVAPNEYLDKIVDQSLIKIYAIANVKETKQSWSQEDDLVLQKPRMAVQIRGSPRVGQECQATFSFQNPLNVPLSECYFTLEGPGIHRPRRIRYRDVRPGELVSYIETFVPRRSGETKLVCTFTSRQITDVTGSQTVIVHN